MFFWCRAVSSCIFALKFAISRFQQTLPFTENFALIAKTYAPKISGDIKVSRNFSADEVGRRVRLSWSVKFERQTYLLAKPHFLSYSSNLNVNFARIKNSAKIRSNLTQRPRRANPRFDPKFYPQTYRFGVYFAAVFLS